MAMFKSLVRILKITRLIIGDRLIKANSVNVKNKTKELLIVKTDAIGDYILFRNLLPTFRNSERFKGFKIVLLGNLIWKDVAENLDAAYVDEFIWIHPGNFKKDRAYRNSILIKLSKRRFNAIINPTRSRYLEIDDALVKAASTDKKIGREGDGGNIPKIYRKLSARIYDELIPEDTLHLFEFETNRHFVSAVCRREVKETLPSIEHKEVDRKNNIIIIPGAGEERKKWRAENFAWVIQNLPEYYKNFKVQYLGSKDDADIASHIMRLSGTTGENLCGKTTLPEVYHIIAESSLVLTNDTGLMHIAAATSTPCICVINGIHLGRFAPYPEEARWMHFVYPPAVQKEIESEYKKYTLKYKYDTEHHVNEIRPELIVAKILSFIPTT